MKKQLLIMLITLLSFNTVSLTASEVKPKSATNKNASLCKKIDEIAAKMMKNNHIPGLVIGISFPDNSIYLKGYGKANLELGVNTEINSVFEIASISKTFTAIGILILQEEGKLDVSDNVSKYFPQFPNGEIITIKQLLQHTSGLKELTEIEPFKSNQIKNWTPQELMKMIESAPLDFEPGQKIQYSNSGCIVLGLIIERLSGVSFNEFMFEHIAKPLGMRNTKLGSNSDLIENRVAGYVFSGGEIKNAEYASISAAYTSGGVISTIEDMVKFKKVFKPGVLLTKKSINSMCAPASLNNGKEGITKTDSLETTFGYGLDMFKFNDYFVPGKTGVISGFNSYFAYFEDKNTLVVILSNLDNSLGHLLRATKNISELIKCCDK